MAPVLRSSGRTTYGAFFPVAWRRMIIILDTAVAKCGEGIFVDILALGVEISICILMDNLGTK